MCGFAGIVRLGERPLPHPSVLRRMLACLEHRGPDEAGEWLGEDVQLGALRLAIIDLKDGHQPVSGCDGAVTCVINGEIYNHHALRSRLRQSGHSLPNACDSSVVPHLYEERGVDCLSDLTGMFAFALWDARRRELLLARDRVGIKPLYWARAGDHLLFASEIKALLASGLLSATIDRESLDDLFSLSYPCPPRTLFEGIFELRPAHWWRISARRGAPPAQRYWRAPFPRRGEQRRIRRRDAEVELRELLKRVVYDHLQADVPVATYLSGGLDSAVISGIVKEVTGDPPTTFSIGFDSAEHDERPHAQRVVEALGGVNHSVVCGPETAQHYPRTIWHTELPLQFPLALPLSQLAGRARAEGYRCVLTGEGADELMGGYDCFRADKMRRLFDRPLLRVLRSRVYKRLYAWHGLPEGTVERMLELQERPSAEVRASFSGVFPAWYEMWNALDVDRERLLSPDGRRVRPPTDAPAGFAELVREDIEQLHPLDAALALEFETRLPAWMLLIGDRASMAAGVEARVPLLDHRLVEYIASLPPSFKMRGFTEKSVLRGAVRGLLPDAVRLRQKRPFYTPLKSWFFSDGAPDYVEEVLSERAIRAAGLFEPGIVSSWRRELRTVPDHHLRRVQLEWLLVLVLGSQLLDHMFVRDKSPDFGGDFVS